MTSQQHNNTTLHGWKGKSEKSRLGNDPVGAHNVSLGLQQTLKYIQHLYVFQFLSVVVAAAGSKLPLPPLPSPLTCYILEYPTTYVLRGPVSKTDSVL